MRHKETSNDALSIAEEVFCSELRGVYCRTALDAATVLINYWRHRDHLIPSDVKYAISCGPSASPAAIFSYYAGMVCLPESMKSVENWFPRLIHLAASKAEAAPISWAREAVRRRFSDVFLSGTEGRRLRQWFIESLTEVFNERHGFVPHIADLDSFITEWFLEQGCDISIISVELSKQFENEFGRTLQRLENMELVQQAERAEEPRPNPTKQQRKTNQPSEPNSIIAKEKVSNPAGYPTMTARLEMLVAQKLANAAGNPVMSMKEAAHALGKSVSTIYRWCDDRKLARSGSLGKVTTASVKHLIDHARDRQS